MDRLRSSIADWITIVTGLFTLISGFISVYFNKATVALSTYLIIDYIDNIDIYIC